MDYIKVFRKAGQPTAAAPLYLCKQAQEALTIWNEQPLETIYERVNRQLSEIDRYEFLALDNGIIKGMMIICIEPEELHTGQDILYTKLAFSTVPGVLTEGYRQMRRLAKELNIPYIHFSRHPDTLKKVK